MIAEASRKVVRLLASAVVPTLLLAFVGLWAVLASVVPQGSSSSPAVSEWASAHPVAESAVKILGLHHAFTAPLFALCVFSLAALTALCAWRRTRVASTRARMLRSAAALRKQPSGEDPHLEIDCDPALGPETILRIAGDTLRHLGIRTRQRDETITAVSPAWSVWGSPVFHWALVALIVMMPIGALLRSSGQIGLAVGQSKPDEPASYGLLSAGPWHDWHGVKRTIRVDAFDVNYTYEGVNRGPTPTVSVLETNGAVIKSQRVYPNKTLKTGALTIYPADYGLSAEVSVTDASGAEVRRSTELLDFSGKADGGTAPVSPMVFTDAKGTEWFRVYLSVPLDRTQGGYLGRLPRTPSARAVVTSPDGRTLVESSLHPGEEIGLPSGEVLRLLDVGYYARLQLVNDPSSPFLYMGVIVAILGLGMATLSRQMIVTAWVVETPAEKRLVVRLRLWRNVTTNRDEIEAELTRALRTGPKGAAL